MKLDKSRFSILIIFFIFFPCNFSNASDSEFEIHLVENENFYRQRLEINSPALKLRQQPLISTRDIVAYYKNTHEIELTPEAYQRFQEIRKINFPFAVCVGKERIYLGNVVSLL